MLYPDWTYEMAEQEADTINNLNDTDDGWSVYDSHSPSIESACFGVINQKLLYNRCGVRHQDKFHILLVLANDKLV